MKMRVEIYTGGTEPFTHTETEGDPIWVPSVGDMFSVVRPDKMAIPDQVAWREYILYHDPEPDGVQMRVQVHLEPRLGYEDGSELLTIEPWKNLVIPNGRKMIPPRLFQP